MTTKFKQLSLEQRYQINALLKAKLNQTEIPTILQVHKSTISRELKRNIPQRGRGAKEYELENVTGNSINKINYTGYAQPYSIINNS